MKNLTALTLLTLSYWTGMPGPVHAQNLVPNHSFEIYSSCPIGFGPGGPLEAIPWQSATDGTIDYFHPCSNPSVVGVPDNAFGSQSARTGLAYAGGYFSHEDSEYREYLLVPLIQPLEVGGTYYLSFYVSLAGLTCGIGTIGVLFTPDLPLSEGSGTLDYVPQFETNVGFISDTTNWVHIQSCFTAEGGEQYLTIGNFQNVLETVIDPACTNFTQTSYYYVDDVSLTEVPPGDIYVDLGESVEVCDSFEIEAVTNGPNYIWQDGSTEPTLTVTTTGTYSLTVYNGCESGVDEIDVTVNNPPPVSISPDEVTICSGDTYMIDLDPDAGSYEWEDGSTGSTYLITHGGIYQVTLDDGCDITSAQITVQMMDEPEAFSLGADTTLCPGEEIEYYFDPGLGDFEWQDNMTNNSYVIQEEGVYSLMITNMCGVTTDEIEVTYAPAPDVSLGENLVQICEGDPVDFEFDLNPSIGDYLWQDGSTSPIYHISTPGLYTIELTNVCGSATDTLNIVEIGAPVVNFDVEYSLCPGDTFLLNSNGLIGNYLWQDNSNASSYEVTLPGTYALTVTNQCGSGHDSTIVNTVVPPAAPDLGPDFGLCPGEQSILTVDQPGITITWQDLSTADTFVVQGPGIYHVLVSNGCQSVSDTVVVTVQNNPPEIGLPDQITLCQGTTDIIDPIVNGVVYAWSDGSHEPTLTIDTAGTYSLTVTNACGSDMDTIHVLDGGPAPLVTLGPDTSICIGETFTLNPVSSNVMTWLWPDGSNDPNYSTSSAGDVFVEVANGCGVSVDTINIEIIPLTPLLSLGLDIAHCAGNSQVITITESEVDIVWFDGTTENDYVITDSDALVYATITNGCGESSDTLNVTLLPPVPTLNLGNDMSLCPGEIITVDPGIMDVNYLWQDGSTGSSFHMTQQGIIFLAISNSCGVSTDTMAIIESTDGPLLDLGPDLHACTGETITIPSGISGVTYLWQDGSTDNQFIAGVSGWVILTVNNLCGTDTDSVLVDVNGIAPIITLGVDTSICEGSTLLLQPDVDGMTTVEWQDGSTASTYLVDASGIYSITATNQCGSTEDDILISNLPLPAPFSLGADTTICAGGTILLHAPQTVDELLWQDGSTGPTFLADHAQTYSLQITNACGSTTDQVHIGINTDVAEFHLPSPVIICPGVPFILDAQQSFEAAYTWSSGEITPAVLITTPGTYSVEVIGVCVSAFAQVDVLTVDDCDDQDIFIPNVFSPNGDQINDLFTPSFGNDIELTSVDGSIFDRWGNILFHGKMLPFEWNGRYKEQTVMPGVYVYRIIIRYMEGGEEKEDVRIGDVTVLR